MALTIVHMLHRHGQIRQDGLAQMFGATYRADPFRGYGYGMRILLPRLAADPGTWGVHARALFGGQGSLGNGQRVRASDTVPFALWSAAHHLDDLPGALWATAEGLGDVDTTCAITAGVVAAAPGSPGVPAAWLELCEPLPDWTQALASA